MNMESDQIPKLEEVLVAFSRHNPAVGYCQVGGSSFLYGYPAFYE